MKCQILSFVLILGFVAAVSTRGPARSALVRRNGPAADNSLEEEGEQGDLVSCAITAITDVIACFKKLSTMNLEHMTSSGEDSVESDVPSKCFVSALMDFIKCISNQTEIEHNDSEIYGTLL